MADPPDLDAAAAREPRAIAVLERVVRRDLLATIFARFGEPPAPSPRQASDPEAEAQRASRTRALAAVDPHLVAYVERHESAADQLRTRLPRPLKLALQREQASDARSLRLRGLGESVEVEPPEDVRAALEDAVPQAVLRDLHRPVIFFGEIVLRRLLLGFDHLGKHARDEVSAALRHQLHARLGETETSSKLMHRELAALRHTLAQPWADSRPQTPTPVGRSSPGPEDAQWFGLAGGYDPDQ